MKLASCLNLTNSDPRMLKLTSGKYKGKKLSTPSGMNTRPTSEKIRQAVFDSAQNIVEGCTFLDLYAGSGAMGLEAVSRGAKMAVFVEKDNSAISSIEKNIDDLGVDEKTLVISNDIFRAITHLEFSVLQFNLIFIDPPYSDIPVAEKDIKKLLELLDKSPILQKKGKLYLEFASASQLDFSKIKLQRLQWHATKNYGNSKLEIFNF